MKLMHVCTCLLIGFFFSACGIKPQPSVISNYALSSNITLSTIYSKSCSTKSIQLSPPKGVIGIQSTKIYYSKDKNDLQPYRNSYWVELPSISLRRILFINILNKNIFSDVAHETSLLNEDFILESDIIFFNHQVENSNSFVKIGIVFTLIDTKTLSTVKTKTIYVEKETPTIDAKGAVDAFNKALNDISNELTKWLKEVICE